MGVCMLDVRKLSLLREVALQGGITAAAHSLGLSPSAVSQQLARLETEAGVPLTSVLGRGIQLTQAALDLVARTEDILALLEEAEADLVEAREGLTGTVRVASFHTFSVTALAETVRALERIAPGVTMKFVELDPEEALVELTARRADIVLVDEYPGLPLPPGRGLVRHLVARESVRAFLPSADAEPATVPWVAEPRASHSFVWMRSICRGAGFEPTVQFESPDFFVHRRLVEQGVAAAFLPHSVSVGLDPSLAIDVTDGARVYRNLYTLVRRGTEHSPIIAACQAAISDAVVKVTGATIGGPEDPPAAHTVQL